MHNKNKIKTPFRESCPVIRYLYSVLTFVLIIIFYNIQMSTTYPAIVCVGSALCNNDTCSLFCLNYRLIIKQKYRSGRFVVPCFVKGTKNNRIHPWCGHVKLTLKKMITKLNIDMLYTVHSEVKTIMYFMVW